jgi:uncharacterized LabA/DUF88 family protein
MSYGNGPSQSRLVMVFIDGAGLRMRLREYFGRDEFDLFALVWGELVPLANFNIIHGELVRTYFYDAISLEGDPRRVEEATYFDRLRKFDFCQVRLGRLVRPEGSPPRQKGVDALLAIDMVGKAHENQFDIAIVLAGDDDFVDTIQAVRDTGKRVCGAYFDAHASQRLIESFDRRRVLSRDSLGKYLSPPMPAPTATTSARP